MKIDGRGMRSGYTTGACAAAAARAAALALLDGRELEEVAISLPGGQEASFKAETRLVDSVAISSVIKDAGDDPDITHGAEIRATIEYSPQPGVFIDGGFGVGRVTKPGLEIAPGLAAINPVPRQMIEQAVSEIADGRLNRHGLRVIISVPDGERLAKRTLNPRLGITGGISILGTSGIVIPYSVDAYKTCIIQSLDVALACGCRQAVLTTGRRSEKYAQKELLLPEECYVLVGDYIDYALKACANKGMEKVTIWGMPGKVSKLAAGDIFTHCSGSDVNIALLAELAAGCGLDEDELNSLRQTNSAGHFFSLLPVACLPEFSRKLCLRAARECRRFTNEKIRVECIMSTPEGKILGRADA